MGLFQLLVLETKIEVSLALTRLESPFFIAVKIETAPSPVWGIPKHSKDGLF